VGDGDSLFPAIEKRIYTKRAVAWVLGADTYHLARLDRAHYRFGRWYVRQQVRETVRFGADNKNCNVPAGQILLILETLIHCQEYFKACGFGE